MSLPSLPQFRYNQAYRPASPALRTSKKVDQGLLLFRRAQPLSCEAYRPVAIDDDRCTVARDCQPTDIGSQKWALLRSQQTSRHVVVLYREGVSVSSHPNAWKWSFVDSRKWHRPFPP